MNTKELMESLRRSPGDEELRRVLADALLEGADPRGELMVAQLCGRAVDDELRERCVATVRAGVPGLQRVRIEAGLVAELELDLVDVPRIDPAWLAGEPLACITASLPSEESDLEPVLSFAKEMLGACRGYRLTSRVAEQSMPYVLELIADTRPGVLGLDLSPELNLADAPVWPFVEIAELRSGAAALLSRSLPGLRRLALWEAGLDGLEAALALETLEHLDLRGQALSDEDHERLQAWLGSAPGRSVRHERFDLRPSDLDDVFGARGLVWDRDPPLRARVASVPGEELTFACSRGRAVQLHLRDAPEWQRTADAPITAMAAREGALIVGREDGVVESWSLEDPGVERIAELPGAIRSLSVAGEDVAATFGGGWWTSRGEQGEDERVGLTLTPSGMAWADGTRVRVRITGAAAPDVEVELGEPVLALAAAGEVVTAMTGRHVWRLTDPGPELLGFRRSGRPVVVARGDSVAWISSRSSAELVRGADHGNVTYPGSYSGGCDEELAIADLAAAASGFIVTALEHGGMNLLGPDGAMKADEFRGEPHRRWIFIYDGSILIAD